MSAAGALGPVRAGVGIVRLADPNPLLAGGRFGARAQAVVRVLGARQVAQAVISGRTPTAAVLCLGAEADVAHAATMVGLAVLDRRYRRAALTDAAVAVAFALAGATAARTAPRRLTRASALSAWRDRCAERLARLVVPGYSPGADGRIG